MKQFNTTTITAGNLLAPITADEFAVRTLLLLQGEASGGSWGNYKLGCIANGYVETNLAHKALAKAKGLDTKKGYGSKISNYRSVTKIFSEQFPDIFPREIMPLSYDNMCALNSESKTGIRAKFLASLDDDSTPPVDDDDSTPPVDGTKQAPEKRLLTMIINLKAKDPASFSNLLDGLGYDLAQSDIGQIQEAKDSISGSPAPELLAA